ncbi:MAG: alpha/beta hydrolase [Jatrophihabitantaceae bacterium]
MPAASTGMLDVTGARLYYEVRGSGPALLLISTGNGDATPFGPMADQLAADYTVISYDRRGFSRSPLTQPLADEDRLAADVYDAQQLLEHLSQGPCHVLGTCSGAIVAVALAQDCLDRIRTIVIHEPPLVSVLPDAADWLGFHQDLYDTFRVKGAEVARPIFRTYAGLDGDTRPPAGRELPPDELADLLVRLERNQVYWYEHELLTYPAYAPDLDAFSAGADRVVMAIGATSREHFSCRPTKLLAAHLNQELVEFPGGHVGQITHPDSYAEVLAGVLRDRG